VQIVPANVSVDEYGYLLGKVTFVAGLASTPESMQAVLQNEFLVQEFAAAGPVVRVQASLQRDRSTPSGYAWSSSDGPPDRVSTGTSCTARVVLSRAAPITYAFPALGRIAGGSE
jgi:HlyD family secretion protein